MKPTLWLTTQENRENENVNDFMLPVPVMTEHLNHEFNMKFSTDLENANSFKVITNRLGSKSYHMKYSQEPKRTSQTPNDDDDDHNNINNNDDNNNNSNSNNNNNNNNNNHNNIPETRKYWVDVQRGVVSSHGERDPL